MGYHAKFTSGLAQFLTNKEERGAAWLQRPSDHSAEVKMISKVAKKIKTEG